METVWGCGQEKRSILHGNPEKMMLLIQATVFASSIPLMSGRALECIVGHWSWRFLLCRPCYSIFSAVYAFIQKRKHDMDEWVENWSSVRSELAAAACVGPLLEVDLGAVWNLFVRMGDAVPTAFGIVGRWSTLDEIREELNSDDSLVWLREVDRVLREEEEAEEQHFCQEEMEEPASASGAAGVEAALVGRGPAVRRGCGSLELFSRDGGWTAAARAEGSWWAECCGKAIGKKGEFGRKDFRARLLHRLENGVFFFLWLCDPMADGYTLEQSEDLVGEIAEACLDHMVEFVLEVPAKSRLLRTTLYGRLKADSRLVCFDWDWGAWGHPTQSTRKVITSVGPLRTLRQAQKCSRAAQGAKAALEASVRPMLLN